MKRERQPVFPLLMQMAITGAFLFLAEHGIKANSAARVIVIDAKQTLSGIKPYFVSYALDTAQVVCAPWWSQEQKSMATKIYLPFNFNRPELRRLARELSPAVFRVGGTDADKTYYCGKIEKEKCAVPEGYNWKLTFQDLKNISDFSDAADAKILFTLNFGAGPRKNKKTWTEGNAMQLIKDTRKINPARFLFFEAGNEVNAYPATFFGKMEFSAELYAEDVKLLKKVAPELPLVAPATLYHSKGEVPPFLSQALPLFYDAVDIVSFHHYPTQSYRCPFKTFPASEANLLSEKAAQREIKFAKKVKSLAGSKPVWLGETASAVCGGQPGISDTMTDALWYADLLGLMAENGVEVVIRQVLSGGSYELIDNETLQPHPSYIVAHLLSKYGGAQPLSVGAQDRESIRVHVIYSKEKKSMLVWFISHTKTAQEITLNVKNFNAQKAQIWTLSADEESPSVPIVNGKVIHAADIPLNKGQIVSLKDDTLSLLAPPRTVTFVLLAGN